MGKKLLFTLVVALLLWSALGALNTTFARGMAGDTGAAIRALAMAAGLFIAALAVWLASGRAGREVTPGVLGAVFLGLLASGYAAFLAFVPVHRFGTAVTEPLGVIEENYPRRGPHTYRMNSFGFRGREWSAAKPRGTLRGIVIGDSMVFGCGVDDDDTIDAALTRRFQRTHPGSRVEVLNLGVEGTNLPGYVELYRAAMQRLAPDFVVLFLFLPNDLGELEQPSEGDRLGAFSFFTFLFGTNNNPYTYYAMSASEGRSDELKLTFLGRYIAEIEKIRRSFGGAPLFVFLYHADVPAWEETVRGQLGPGAWVVDHDPLPDEDFISGDNHPTAAGNRHFAELIGTVIDRSYSPPSG